MPLIRMEELFTLSGSMLRIVLERFVYPWQALAGLEEAIRCLGETLGRDYHRPQPGIWVHRTAQIADTARMEGCCILGPGVCVRHGGFLRGGVMLEEKALVGNSTEVKNAVFLKGACAPHFNYVGDSILGMEAHLGAGAVISNLKSDKTSVAVRWEGETMDTGRRKCGAFLGDGAEVGCGSVLNPGTVLGRNCIVYPLSCVRGGVPEGYILKPAGLVKRRAGSPAGEE